MELAEKIARLFRSGPFIQFRCSPSTLAVGSVSEVEIEATVFVDESIPRAPWDPIVTSEEPRRLRIRLVEHASSQPGKRVFRGVIKGSEVVPGRYRLEFRCLPEDSPIAVTSLVVLGRSEWQAAEDHFRKL